MSTRIRFFRDGRQAKESRQFLGTRGIKTYIRERENANPHLPPIGYDFFILKDEEAEDARKMLDFEYGTTWGENTY